MTTLYLTEKSSQAAEVAEALGLYQKNNGVYRGNNVIVAHASGHLLEYAEPEAYGEQYAKWTLESLPCVPETWKQNISDSNLRHYQIIKGVLREASEVVIATDADREGEIIARSILDSLGYQGQLKRLWVQETTPSGYKKGFAKIRPGSEFFSLYQSGLGRSRADWLFGMNFTRALTRAFSVGRGNTLHFGRVMTPTLTLVVLRERAIANFKPADYFVISGLFNIAGEQVNLKLIPDPEWLDGQGRLSSPDIAKKVVKDAESHKTYVVSRYETTKEQTKPPLPYYPATLYPECTKKLKLKPHRVDEILQTLYLAKLISYPRTEGEHIPEELFSESKVRLDALCKMDPSLTKLCDMADLNTPSHAFNDAKVAKEGSHFGIITTDKNNFDLSSLKSDEFKVYDLIRRRFIAQFLGNYIFDKTVLELSSAGIKFGASGSTPKVLGWKRAILEIEEEGQSDSDEKNNVLPVTSLNQKHELLRVNTKTEKTKPPPRYDTASLVVAMENIHKEISDPRLAAIMKNKEKAGIGTNATRGDTLKKLFDGGYFSESKGKIIPTDKGTGLIELLEKVCPELADPVLTARWESALSDVEKGQIKLSYFEEKTVESIHYLLKKIRGAAGTIKVGSIEHACPECGSEMVRRPGKSGGHWWACSGYPNCKQTMDDLKGKPVPRITKNASNNASQSNQSSQHTCPNCQSNMVRRKGREDSYFWGCTAFPNCRTTFPDVDGKPVAKNAIKK